MKKHLKPIMFVGTGSDVGKSIINAAFCRIFKQDGYSPAPFKAQNMSLNSYASSEGLEMGRAQVVQAEACGIPCQSAMNPILLKPTSDKQAQVILHGKPITTLSAQEYFLGSDRTHLFNEAIKDLHHLQKQYNPIVLEGAGSISEINLWDKDITNMKVALACQASTILIADIDKGGIFGSIYGTLQLLPKEERALIKGILINKFRGDIKLFYEGKQLLEELCQVKVIGIIPYFRDIHIDEEDSVILDTKRELKQQGEIKIAVILLPHMSNFTDFNTLERIPELHIYYTANPEEIQQAHIIILPGSKNTISDLQWLRKMGIAKAILQAHAHNKAIYGICGGYQMMGEEIHDPYGVESSISSIPGLGLLPITSTLGSEKKTVQSSFYYKQQSNLSQGYEIHMGVSNRHGGKPLCIMEDGSEEGCIISNRLWGSYQHGIFDNESVISDLLESNDFNSIAMPQFNLADFKEAQYNKLAEHVRAHVDMEYIYSTLHNE